MANEGIGWPELLDVLTDSDRKKGVVIERATETERLALFLLRLAGWSARIAPSEVRDYNIEISRPGERNAVRVRNQRTRVNLAQIEKFLKFLHAPKVRSFNQGIYISTSGFTPAVYAYLREEKITDLKLAILRDNALITDCENFDKRAEGSKPTYIGVFTCKGGVGKTTISAHLAGAFAMNGYDVALVDLDPQQNLVKLLGGEVYLPGTRGETGSKITILKGDEWDASQAGSNKIVICDCNPEFDENPREFIRKFDYCIVPTTLNPLGINKNADVINRTLRAIRSENRSAQLHVLINSLHSDEQNRNRLLNDVLKASFEEIAAEDPRFSYIDPADASIRFSKQLLYWGYHLFEGSKPSLAFRSVGRYSYPKLDFLKLVDYLEANTAIPKTKMAAAMLGSDFDLKP